MEGYEENESYAKSVRGVGLMQVTGFAQKEFLTWLDKYGYDFLLKIRELEGEENGKE